VDPDVSFYSRVKLLEICRVRSEKSVGDRKKESRLADRQTCSAPQRERERERERERRGIFLLFCCTLLLAISRELLTGLYVLLQKI
jgi:hypothetical protein